MYSTGCREILRLTEHFAQASPAQPSLHCNDNVDLFIRVPTSDKLKREQEVHRRAAAVTVHRRSCNVRSWNDEEAADLLNVCIRS